MVLRRVPWETSWETARERDGRATPRMKATVVGDDSEVVLHDGLVGFQDTQHGFPADEPDAAIGGGDDGWLRERCRLY